MILRLEKNGRKHLRHYGKYPVGTPLNRTDRLPLHWRLFMNLGK